VKPKVLVAFPVGGSCHPAFARSLARLCTWELRNPCDEYEVLDPEYSASLYVQENRNNLVNLARELGADWLLQVDTDESFEPHALRQLMKTAERCKAEIVTGLYTNAQRAPAEAEGGFLVVDMIFREVQRDEVDEKGNPLHAGEYVNIIPPSDSRPFVVDAFGSGIMLTHVPVFERIEWPWFWLEMIVPAGKDKPQIMNEDLAFCRKAREAGYTLWCDPLVEAVHYKQLSLLPSTFHHFLARARETQKEMAGRES
jgi:GT2 family glycosyltransferase